MSESHPYVPPGEPAEPSPLHPDPESPTQVSSENEDGDPREEVRTDVADAQDDA